MIGVTGGTGFVGRRLIPHIAKRSPVRVLARNPVKYPEPNAEYMVGELGSTETVDRFVRGCTSIIHLAGVAHTGLRTKADRDRSYSVNVDGTKVAVDAAIRQGVRRIVFVSTAHVYADQTGLELDENAPTAATSFYSETKIKAEELVREAGKNGLEIVIVRPCPIYGPDVPYNLAKMMRGIDRSYYFHISSCNPMRSFLSVEVAARALYHLVHHDIPHGTYNLADERPYSLVDFANELADRMKRPRPRTLPIAVVHATAAIASAAKLLGVNPPNLLETVSKLTSSFTLNTRRLAQTGFKWNCDEGALRQEMVDHYLCSSRILRPIFSQKFETKN